MPLEPVEAEELVGDALELLGASLRGEVARGEKGGFGSEGQEPSEGPEAL